MRSNIAIVLATAIGVLVPSQTIAAILVLGSPHPSDRWYVSARANSLYNPDQEATLQGIEPPIGMQKVLAGVVGRTGQSAALAGFQYSSSPSEVLLDHWVATSYSGSNVGAHAQAVSAVSITIAPESTESIGDPITVFAHLVSPNAEATLDSVVKEARVIDSFGFIVADFIPLGSPTTVAINTTIGETFRIRTGLERVSPSGASIDVRHSFTLSDTAPEPPIVIDIPEPSSIVLAAMGMLFLWAVWWRRQKRSNGSHALLSD